MKDLCRNQPPLCRCIRWGDEDFDMEVDYLIHNFEFLRLELEYDTLAPGADWRLCQIGRCRRCGGRLCVGTRMTARDTLEDTLASIHLLAGQRWQGHTGKCPDGNKDFRELFIQLFHEDDRQAVQNWLSHQDGPTDDRQTGTPEQEVR